MINIAIGLIIGLGFFIAILGVFYLGYRIGKKKKPNVKRLSEDEMRELKRKEEGFKNIMNYDYQQAIQKVVG